MKANPRCVLVVLLLVALDAARTALGAEPVEQFLEALRAHRYYDEAFGYLDQIEAAAQLEPSLRERIPFERAVTMVSSASDSSDPQVRQTRLARAAELFDEFCRSHPQHTLVASAKNELASILIQRGRGAMQAADASTKNPSADAARQSFEQAREQLVSAEKDLQSQMGQMPKLVPPDDPAMQAHKRQLSADLAQARLLLASIDFELAQTYEPTSAKAKEHFSTAAKNFAAYYDNYRTWRLGVLARLWEGNCYQELGQHNQALGCYRELMDLPDANETRSIKTKSTRHALECWTNPNVKNYQAAIERGERWEKASSVNATDADALAIRYLTALAYQEQSKSLPDKDPNRKKLVSFARQYVGPVAQHPGEFQRPAKMLLVALSGGKNSKDEAAAPKTFAEALEQARQELGRMQGFTTALSTAATGKADKTTLDDLQRQKAESAGRALAMLRLALSLSNAETPLEDLNSTRYYFCYLCWDLGRYYDAAVLGEFLAQRFPDTLYGRQGARIALAAYVRLYGESDALDRSFELAQIQRIAELTFQRWPDQEEAEEAALTLVNFAAASQQVEKATEYLDKISKDSPRRAQAELRAGQALWSAYLRALRMPDEDRPPPEKLDALKNQAQDILTQGIDRVGKAGTVDANLASAVFSLAQICLETGQTDKAISLLEHPTYGPLTLAKAKNPAAAREGFATETYKMALRAYVTTTPSQVKKAEDAMNALEQLVQSTGDAQAGENLTAIYLSLGHQLQEQLQELRKSGKTKELEAVSQSFEAFLDRVVKRNAGGDYASLNWIGETYFSLGAGFDEGGSSPRANAYFEKATTAYERMLAEAEKDPKFKDQPDALVGIRLRLADCYRRTGNFDKAIKTVAGVLNDRSMLLTAQVQAAEIYQAQGAVDPNGYALSITGSMPNREGRNLVWGWAKISKMTMSNPKFEDTFHQARLSIAEARYRYALAQKDSNRRTKVLQAAVQDLWSTYKLRPTLGGPETTARYDRTLKMIQKALGEPETGLAEFKQRDAASAAATTK